MSVTVSQQAMLRMNHAAVMVAVNKTSLQMDLQTLHAETPESGERKRAEVMESLCAAYGFDSKAQNKPFAFQNGVAIIPIHGSLINRFGQCYGYVTGYNFIRRQRDAAMADPDVTAIVYDVNSGGGEAAGCFELADESFALRGTKPTISVVDSACYSAAYALASTSDQVVVTPTGGAGSVGVYTMHVDMSKMLENWGLEITLIHAGEHKVDGHPYAELPEDVRADMQKSVDATYNKFVESVARNRNLSVEAVKDTQARCYSADDALALGLIDSVASPLEAIRAFLGGPSEASNDETTGDSVMELNEAKQAERQRVGAIIGHPNAKGREAMANHLALNTDMSVDDAAALLAVAPVAHVEVVEKTEEAAKPKNEKFVEAMNQDDHPNVGPDGKPLESAEKTQANELMEAFTAATGYDFTK
ncbi:MAG: S49 family peptidase [Armatimonadia bacterium]